jgi:hypothetical protein
VDLPTHEYNYQGEAVVGRNLNELQVGVSGGLRFARVPDLSAQAYYVYAFVEKPLDDVSVNRSSGAFDVGYALSRRLYVRGTSTWTLTHGGLRAGSDTGNPFPLPGELNTSERRAQGDRLIKVKYWQAGGGASYTAGPVDVFASIAKYVWGRDAHNGWGVQRRHDVLLRGRPRHRVIRDPRRRAAACDESIPARPAAPVDRTWPSTTSGRLARP